MSFTDNPAIIVFSAPVVRQLSTRDGRLEPTYVGVRRVRPSSRAVQEALLSNKANKASPTDADNSSATTDKQKVSKIVFKVVGDDGVERRMTKQEKKARKRELLQEKEQAKRQRQEQREATEARQQQNKKGKKRSRKEVVVEKEKEEEKVAIPEKEETTTEAATVQTDEGQSQSQSIEEEDIDSGPLEGQTEAWLEQELADLKGERNIPPVILSSSLARVSRGILKSAVHPRTEEPVEMDDEYAQRWAIALQESMHPAIETRQKEDMRSMVYQLTPEVWSRFRPESLRNSLHAKRAETTETAALTITKEESTAKEDSLVDVQDEGDAQGSWKFISIRPLSTQSSFDDDLAAVVKVLYQNTSLHISCGAKFGCDLLLYDGPRNERHAFAGLRLISAPENNGKTTDDKSDIFPLLSAYCLAGYVRCLNTAAKLALVASVRRERLADGSTMCKVALVDVKLERVDGTKKRDLEVRLQNLQKSTNTTTTTASVGHS